MIFYSSVTGVPAAEKMQISDSEKGLELINNLTYVPKDIIYKDRK